MIVYQVHLPLFLQQKYSTFDNPQHWESSTYRKFRESSLFHGEIAPTKTNHGGTAAAATKLDGTGSSRSTIILEAIYYR